MDYDYRTISLADVLPVYGEDMYFDVDNYSDICSQLVDNYGGDFE